MWAGRVDPDGPSKPIKPVLTLARLARDRGVAVFFLTGRSERSRTVTEGNLRRAGYEWTALILKPDDLTTTSAVDFKAPERKKLVDQGYTIIVNIGDQMSDLDGGFAERTYKLPNPFYFIP
jgi:predicted secreted acid phosphatase